METGNGDGVTVTEADFAKKFALDKEFKQVRKVRDPRLGEVKLFQHSETRAVVALKELKLGDKKSAEHEILKCKKRMRISSQYILPIVDYSVELQKSLCASHYLLSIYYEYPPSDLKNELAQKQKKGEHFSTEEMLHLVYQAIEAQKTLELARAFHGDVRPVYWGLNTSLWHSKLVYKPEEIDSVQQARAVQTAHLQSGDAVYQSPALFEALSAKNAKFEFNANKEDMFATALTLIELGTQDSLQDVYGKKGAFDHDAMRRHVAKFEQVYAGPENTLLVTSVLTMLEPEEARRPHFVLLSERMPSYYTVVKHFESLRENAPMSTENPLLAFIYIDKAVIDAFTLEPGVQQVKQAEAQPEPASDAVVKPAYSTRSIAAPKDVFAGGNYTGNGKVVERIIRRFEERDGVMVESVEHFNVGDDGVLAKTETYELVGGKRTKVKYYDSAGNEIVSSKDLAEQTELMEQHLRQQAEDFNKLDDLTEMRLRGETQVPGGNEELKQRDGETADLVSDTDRMLNI